MYKNINNCGDNDNNDCGDDDYVKSIEIDSCDELKNIKKKDNNTQKDLEVLENFPKKDKKFEDHACYELHLGYSEKQMQKQVHGPFNEKTMIKKYENLVAFNEAYEHRTEAAQKPLTTVRPEFSTEPAGLLKRVTFDCPPSQPGEKSKQRRDCPLPRSQCSKSMSWVNDDGGLVDHRLDHNVGPKGNQLGSGQF